MRLRLNRFCRTTFSSLKARNFRLYFAGQGISFTGGWMQSIAQSWLVLHLTGSATALGVTAALQFAPTLFLGPYAGVLADRLPKRRLLFVTQTISAGLALVLGIAVATGTARPWMVYATALALGLVTAVDYPLRQAFLYDLAGPRQLVSAVGLTSTVANLARVAGPALAGVLIAATGLAICFFVNAASFLAVLVCLLLMRPDEFHGHARSPGRGGGLLEGVRYASSTPIVRETLVMMAAIGVLTYEFAVTLPALVRFEFGGSAAGLAWLMSSMGLGAAAGGLFTAGRTDEGLGKLAWSALAFGLATAGLGLAPTLPVATVLMFAVGVFSARFTALSNGILQLGSAPAMRSRVMALWSTAFLGSTFLGAPLVGWLAESAGPRWALAVGALGGLAAAWVGWRGGVRWERASSAWEREAEGNVG